MFKIQIVEDELLEAELLKDYLEAMEMEVVAISKSADDAIADFKFHQPDLLFIDIHLQGKKTGIDVAEYVNKYGHVPFIYLSSHFGAKSPYFKAATATKPAEYLPKSDYQYEHLGHFVDRVMTTHYKVVKVEGREHYLLVQDRKFIKSIVTGDYLRVYPSEVVKLEYNKPHVDICIKENSEKAHCSIRGSIEFVLDVLGNQNLIRINKGHVVNIDYIEKYNISKNKIHLFNGEKLSVGRSYKEDLDSKISLLR